MEPLTRFVASADGTRIAYDSQGRGPALILLPGHGFSRRTWHEFGYPLRLQEQFTVITVDHRNEGESEKPTRPEDYTIDHYIADIHAVADACGMNDFFVWGHSFGATISTHLSAVSSRLRAVEALGMHLHVFDGLNHMQELTEIDRVLPPVLAFLKVHGG